MDFSVSFTALTLCLVFLSAAEADDCVARITSSKEFQECMNSYSTFMSNADLTTGQNPLCSAQGLSETKCFMPFLMNCSALTDVKAFASLKPYASPTGMEELCKASAGGPSGTGMGGDPACMAAAECAKGMGNMSAPAGSSDMDDKMGMKMFQMQSTIMCGPIKDMFECMDNIEGECAAITESMNSGLGQTMPGMNMDKMKNFIRDYCSELPSDFGTNTCVTEKLGSLLTEDCVKNATMGVETPACSDYQNLFACKPLAECGVKYEQALKKVANFFISMSGSKCELTQTSNSNTIRVSFLTVLFAVLMMFKLI